MLTDEDKTPPEFIVEDLIPVGLTFLSGAPKLRKSFLALQLASAVATGTEFLSLTVFAVLILAASTVFGPLRSSSIGARVVVGIVFGFSFRSEELV